MVSIVIAAYNERENVEKLSRRIRVALRSLPDWRSEIIFVVEGRDGTKEVLERCRDDAFPIRLLYNPDRTGLGCAYRRGFAAVSSESDYVVTMDADLNHQPEELPRLLEAARDRGADILVGSRFVRGGRVDGTPLWKLFLSGTLNIVMRVVFGLPVKDKTSGYRVYAAPVVRRIAYANDDFAFLPEILIRARAAGQRIVEEPIHFIFRSDGKSKMNVPTTVLSYLALLTLRFRRIVGPKEGPP